MRAFAPEDLDAIRNSTSLCGYRLLRFRRGSGPSLPRPDVQQIYQRLLPQIEKIPAFDHHAHPGYADDPDVDAMAAPPNASEALRTATTIPNWSPLPRPCSIIPTRISRPNMRNGSE